MYVDKPNDVNTIIKLKYENMVYEREINELRLQKENNLNTINTLQKEILDSKFRLTKLLFYEENQKILSENIEKLEKDNNVLKEENHNLIKNIQLERETYNRKAEQAVNVQKAYIDSVNSRLAAFESIEKLNKVQQVDIQLLEKEIGCNEKEYNSKFNSLKIYNAIKFSDFKNNMMKHIEFTQQNVEKLNLEHMDLSSKVTLLQNNQLLLKIESLTKLLEELLLRISENDKEIVQLKKEVDIHKEVENSLAEKNRHYLNVISTLSETIDKFKLKDNERNKDNKLEFQSMQENEKKNISNNNTLNNNEINFRTSNSKRFNRSNSQFFFKEIQSKPNDKSQIIQLEKLIEKKKKEYEYLKTKYDLIQDKFNSYEQKISAIYKLIEQVLNEFSKDSTIQDNNEIVINSERIMNAEFDTLSKEQKYSLLSILMKKLIPFIISEGVEEHAKFKNIKLQYQPKCLNISSSSFFSETNAKSLAPKRLGVSFLKRISFSKDFIGIKKKNEHSKYKFPDNPSIFNI